MTSAIPDDPKTAAVDRVVRERASARSSTTVVGIARVPLDAVSQPPAHRRKPTSATSSPTRCAPTPAADVAIVNSGSIRGNRIYPAGPLTRRTLIEMHPFGNVVVKLAMPGRVRAAGAEQRRRQAAGCRRACFRRSQG